MERSRTSRRRSVQQELELIPDVSMRGSIKAERRNGYKMSDWFAAVLRII